MSSREATHCWLLSRLYFTLTAGCVVLLLAGCGAKKPAEPTPPAEPVAETGASSQQQLTLYIAEMAEQLDIL